MGPTHGLLESIPEQDAVRQVGERVIMRLVIELLFPGHIGQRDRRAVGHLTDASDVLVGEVGAVLDFDGNDRRRAFL